MAHLTTAQLQAALDRALAQLRYAESPQEQELLNAWIYRYQNELLVREGE